MSFILDALKKLERERETREPGVLMVGPVQWGGPERPRARRRLAVGAALVAVVAASALWWLSSRPAPATPDPSSEAAPATRIPTTAPPATERRPTQARSEQGEPPRSDEHAPEQMPGALPVPPPRSVDLPGDASEPDAGLSAEATPIVEGPPGTPADAAVATGAGDPPTSPPQPAFRLTAISERDGEPIALLNDRLVREGDRFGDLRVLRIGETEVEIEVNGERRTIGF